MAGERKDETAEAACQRARLLITEAMDLLDAHRGSRTAAAHLALALEEMREQPDQRRMD